MRYHLWTVGCQMNEADSERLARELDNRGLAPVAAIEHADVIVLTTCSVRQAAEDKALSKAGTLKSFKLGHQKAIVALGGCMVADDTREALRRRLPFVDVFFKPGEFGDLLALVDKRLTATTSISEGCLTPTTPEPPAARPGAVSRWLPVMTGCNRRCSYCIVPFRRGRERSLPVAQVVAEAASLVAEGAREITLLGQIVDRYGHDLPDRPDLADLLGALSALDPGVARIRFLTSHPRDFADRILEAIAALPRVCEHVNIPVQSGDDDVLRAMGRGYTTDFYRQAIGRIRRTVPGVALATDVIVGFPGETEEQFQRTLDLLAELRFDVVHVAMYSPRPGTRAAAMPDDVPAEDKKSRLLRVEALHEQIATEINAALLGQTVGILVESKFEGRYTGRTRTNKLVFFADEREWEGKLAKVRIARTGPWSLSGTV